MPGCSITLRQSPSTVLPRSWRSWWIKPNPRPCEDGSLVLGNLMIAAYAIGVGSCWIHRAKQVFEFEEGKALLKRWGLSENYVGVGFCILGYAAGEAPKPAARKEGYVIKAT
ncbi:MAG: nitroreductase family protein [Treponema sp.]|nr:nitroreductase family protein [Treponema sp.]